MKQNSEVGKPVRGGGGTNRGMGGVPAAQGVRWLVGNEHLNCDRSIFTLQLPDAPSRNGGATGARWARSAGLNRGHPVTFELWINKEQLFRISVSRILQTCTENIIRGSCEIRIYIFEYLFAKSGNPTLEAKPFFGPKPRWPVFTLTGAEIELKVTFRKEKRQRGSASRTEISNREISSLELNPRQVVYSSLFFSSRSALRLSPLPPPGQRVTKTTHGYVGILTWLVWGLLKILEDSGGSEVE